MFEKEIQELARKLLSENRVELVIGFAKANVPYTTRPCVIYNPEQVDRLIFNRFSRLNLAAYLSQFKGRRVAIVAKGCDARSINMLVVEKQIDRKNIYIIGVPCPRMLDKRKLSSIMPDPYSVEFEGDKIILTGRDGKIELDIENVLDKTCAACSHRTPVIYDTLLGEPIEEKEKDYEKLIGEFKRMTQDRRWELFSEELTKCIRCYACRQACPTCYCEECFVDCNKPRWVSGGLEKSDIMFWHIGRIYHQAGRCVNCGSCSYVCPVDIDFAPLLLYMEEVVKNSFGYEAGVKIDELPPLQTFKKDDPQEFIM